MAARLYSLRKRKNVEYKDGGPALPRATRVVSNKLYPIEIVEEHSEKVKIHYKGYNEKYDEWRDKKDIVLPKTMPPLKSALEYHPFSLYNELKYLVKMGLDSKRRKEPEVRIEMPFDEVLFNGGLKASGVFQRCSHGHEVYTINNFESLSPFLGGDWWYKCLNKHLNFCYVNKDTVRYYLHARLPVTEYNPSNQKVEETVSGNYALVFWFVRMDGVARQWAEVTGSQTEMSRRQ